MTGRDEASGHKTIVMISLPSSDGHFDRNRSTRESVGRHNFLDPGREILHQFTSRIGFDFIEKSFNSIGFEGVSLTCQQIVYKVRVEAQCANRRHRFEGQLAVFGDNDIICTNCLLFPMVVYVASDNPPNLAMVHKVAIVGGGSWFGKCFVSDCWRKC
ncbi:conserved hypothetical protein [Trichinella spiralis]|uniref:hypothetical protein n=1 Tax=Trichinella spiralis TaxID=6334 RepID=UPI0001EFEC00|nr:conserved hypothetical protein [Trichinella spiralis]